MQLISLLAAAALLQPGGLHVKDVKVGKGPAAEAGDVLTMLYKGTLKDGKVFDENMGGDKPPFAFRLGAGQVIKGWDEGLAGMKVGGERILTIPSDLAYGSKGAGGVIPPDAQLTFDVKMLRIDKKDAKPHIEVKELKGGTGPASKEGDTVKVHYKGMYLNGLKFDSSYDRNEPLEATIGKTKFIAGFTQGITGMKLGEKRRVTIPYALGYGERHRDPIPPLSTLVFELEMMSIAPGATTAPQTGK
jgi:FKBP-type peptidyl-prolyl cis-trans isomerase